jgi:Domain of unknown function (DUF4288)
MGFIPRGAEWYIADIVEEIRVEGDRRNVLHINQVLVRADSPGEAYARSLELGKHCNLTYRNQRGKNVRINFRGLRDLSVVHDKLEHGAELSYQEMVGVTERKIRKWIRTKEELGVFAAPQKPTGPDYADGEIMRELAKRFPGARPKSGRRKRKTRLN